MNTIASPRQQWPTDCVLPDYSAEGGIYGLAASIRHWLHDPAAACAPAQLAEGEPGRILLLVIDGLGANFLAQEGAGSTLAAHCRRQLTSVFPSTTASAVTTLLTGATPAEHGLNGWFIHAPRFGGVIAPLPFEVRGGEALAPRLASRLFRASSMFHRARRPVVMISPAEIAFSTYSSFHGSGAQIRPYKGLPQFEDEIVSALAGLGDQGGLVHAYYPKFDGFSHAHGCRAEKTLACFARIDEMYARLCERLAGSEVRILLTADHGFIDSPPEQVIELEPGGEVEAMLAAPLFGERRLSFCAVRAGAEVEFEHWAQHTLAGKAVCMPAGDCLASGVLGPGRRHPQLAERLGSHVLLMEPGWTLVDLVEGERPFALIGVHGGLTADEMLVPLVAYQA
ncbi:MAG: alkaline phosphatase family protein [Thauera sp.]|jgi:hypothetical protein|nr:alkaline phosphatase family protein [Thauera sp.]